MFGLEYENTPSMDDIELCGGGGWGDCEQKASGKVTGGMFGYCCTRGAGGPKPCAGGTGCDEFM